MRRLIYKVKKQDGTVVRMVEYKEALKSGKIVGTKMEEVKDKTEKELTWEKEHQKKVYTRYGIGGKK